ncbi:cobalamin biosynthesis protein CobD [Oceaniovalibus guishaninsula JLT2003]|uniref:Cobalamin biosynthesis protein CobD n=1 Tax=Oceaniovalibus guishaninsula JLT2003 TaxID=1231392 RepID=K2GNQ7_9RHOB|nr:adenosylcobinamide-phosphate synthase CbiB [Oceaniovalibus guishaninsula]EKE44296.1 cobalamin biosynthesis protein CobD [Oceaniovalibus guishaninsula JLT2003]
MTLVLALLLDAALGEPRWLWSRLPHPAILMGRAVGWADARFNRGADPRAAGVLALAGLIAVAWAIGAAIASLGPVATVPVAAILLAQRSLAQHVAAVAEALRRSLPEGRKVVAMIVGRDTQAMDPPAIARAAIESAAENLGDGVVAPAFWFAILGLPGLIVYKLVNTADSMIGHRTPRHERFGWAAARLDDALNWVPARLTALLIAGAGGAWRGWARIRIDAPLHRSPNAGWPEAAMAVALGVALSGPRSYDGRMRDFPFVNAPGRRDIGPAEIDAAVTLLWKAWAVLLGLAAVLALTVG